MLGGRVHHDLAALVTNAIGSARGHSAVLTSEEDGIEGGHCNPTVVNVLLTSINPRHRTRSQDVKSSIRIFQEDWGHQGTLPRRTTDGGLRDIALPTNSIRSSNGSDQKRG